MSVILLLIGASLLVALLFLGAFIWSIRSGQYEDDYTPSVRMLFDNTKTKSDSNIKSNVDGTGKV
jgi:cbb3-type cytochrome oxidase maturation protein